MSESMFDQPSLVRRAQGSDSSDFRRNAPDRGESAKPRDYSNAAFNRYMGESEKDDGPSRLQEMRKKFGWKALRPRWWNQDSRGYQNAWKAEQLRFRGIGGKLQPNAMEEVDSEIKAARRKTSGESHSSSESDQSPDPLSQPAERTKEQVAEAKAKAEARSRMVDGKMVSRYSTLKTELKNAAGWRRFVPLSDTRAAYRRGRDELRTGNFTNAGIGKFSARMPTVVRNQERHQEVANRDLEEIQALLGPQGDSGSASGGQLSPPEGVDAELWRRSREASAELDAPDDDDAESAGGRPPSMPKVAMRARQVSEEEPNPHTGMGGDRSSSVLFPNDGPAGLRMFEQTYLRKFLEDQNKDDD